MLRHHWLTSQISLRTDYWVVKLSRRKDVSAPLNANLHQSAAGYIDTYCLINIVYMHNIII